MKIDIVNVITNKLKDLIEYEEIRPEDKLYYTGYISSIVYVKLLVLLEEEYGIEFEEDMLIFDEVVSIASIAEYVSQKCDLN